MSVITIPQKILKGDDIVVMPRQEYEALVKYGNKDEFTPTAAQKRSLKEAEQNFRNKKTLSYNELRQKLGFTN